MTKILQTVRNELSEGALAHAELKESEERLVAVVERNSLGALIASAIISKNHGRMDDAISQITKANRLQLDAIEGTTKALDEVFDRPTNEVIFARYRQIPPSEMGVEGAGDVLDLIRIFHEEVLLADKPHVERLHELETAQTEEVEALTFFRKRFSDGSAETEIKEAESKLISIAEELERSKNTILSAVFSTISVFLSEHHVSKIRPSTHYKVAGWLYQIVTSTTLTKPASDVAVD